MAQVDYGTEASVGLSGKIGVTFHRVAEPVIEAREECPPALRLTFKVRDNEQEVSLAVPIGPGAEMRLRPLVRGKRPPTEESELRQFVVANIDTEPHWVRAWDNFIQAFLAPPGDHIGTLVSLRQAVNSMGAKRIWFTLETGDGLQSEFSAPWPDIRCKKGQTPTEDYIGPAGEFNPRKGPFFYLTRLGLDWGRFIEELQRAPALWDGHFDQEGMPLNPYFASMDDLTPELMKATQRHGLSQVKWTVHIHERYGLGVKRGRIFFELAPVAVVEDPKAKQFRAEVERFVASWDSLTKVVHADDDAKFMRGGRLTANGRDLVNMALVPIVRAYPQCVTERKEDGTPAIHIPPTTDTWRLNGMICLSGVAEQLLAHNARGETDLSDPTGLVDSRDPAKLLNWVSENAPELAEDQLLDEEVF